MSSNEPPHSDLLTDKRWAYLVSPLRPYFLKPTEEDQKCDLKLHVLEVVTLFSDKDARPETCPPRLEPVLKAICERQPPPKHDDPLLRSLRQSLSSMQSARGFGSPQPALTRQRLRRVQRLTAALSEAISLVIDDPWLNLAAISEIAAFTARGRPAGWKRDLKSITLELLGSGQAPFAATLEDLKRKTKLLPKVADIAAQGLGSMRGKQLKGRPPDGGFRLPSLLLAGLARRYAPPPSRRPRGHRTAGVWRAAVADFVDGILTETGIPTAPREFLEEQLRSS